MNNRVRKQIRAKKRDKAPRPDRQTIMAALDQLGGREEVDRYGRVEKMEFLHGSNTVIHYYKLGKELAPTWKKHERNGLKLYAIGLHRNIDVLRAAIRMAELWTQHDVANIVAKSQRMEHELNWSHFRRLINEELNDVQRDQLIEETIANKWHYRELELVIQGIVGKRSAGGRKVARPKSFRGAVGAMLQRSRAWLKLEEGWADELQGFAARLPASERYTRKNLALALEAAAALQRVRDRATEDYDRAQALVDELNARLDRPAVAAAVDDGPAPVRRRKQRPGRSLAATAR